MAQSIFDKTTELKPSAMATGAERRCDDAQALCETGENARANGAAYLAGFVVEILLKARLIDKYPQFKRQRQNTEALSKEQRKIWSLIWRQHDLEAVCEHLDELMAALKKQSEREGKKYDEDLRKIYQTWTIHARYSTHTIDLGEARKLIKLVGGLKEKLK